MTTNPSGGFNILVARHPVLDVELQALSKRILERSFGYDNFYYSVTRCNSAADEVETNRETWEKEEMWRVEDSRNGVLCGKLGWHCGGMRNVAWRRG